MAPERGRLPESVIFTYLGSTIVVTTESIMAKAISSFLEKLGFNGKEQGNFFGGFANGLALKKG